MPKRAKGEKAERAAKRRYRLETPSAAADAGVASADGDAAVELLETVSMVELARLRNRPSVANVDSDDEDGGAGDQLDKQQAGSAPPMEDEATAARVALRRKKGEKLLKSGQQAKALVAFEAALKLQPANEELQLLVETTRGAACAAKHKAPPSGTTELDDNVEDLKTLPNTKKKKKQNQEQGAGLGVKRKKVKEKRKSKKARLKSTTGETSAPDQALARPNSSLDIGTIEELRAQRGIVVVGPSVDGQPGPWCTVAPIARFTDAVNPESHYRLSPELVSRLSRHTRPTAVQAQCVPLALAGHDIVAVAPTGSGKTLAFLVPLLAHAMARRAATTSSSHGTPVTNNKAAQKSKQNGSVNSTGKAADANTGAPEGSWICPDCGNLNFPLRDTCNTRTCKAARPPQFSVSESEAATARNREREPARPFALVLCPSRELAHQIYEQAQLLVAPSDSGPIGPSSKPLRVVCLYGGVPKGEQATQLTEGVGSDNTGDERTGPAEVVIATPGRCLDFIQESKYLGVPLALDQVRFLVLDEADQMLQAGFLKTIMQIAGRCAPRPLVAAREKALRAELRRYREEDSGIGVARALKRLQSEQPRQGWAAGLTGSDVAAALDTLDISTAETHAGSLQMPRQTVFVTATWVATVQAAAAKVMGDNGVELHIEQPRSGAAPECDDDAGARGTGLKANLNVRQRVQVVELHKEKLPLLRVELQDLLLRNPFACAMVFCKTKKRCDWLAGKLQAKGGGGWVRALHSDKSQPEREEVLSEFRALASSGNRSGVLVATNVASRGLDIPTMSLVIVYDFSSLDSYVHKIGRTGRGEDCAGESLTFYVPGDGEATGLVDLLQQAGQSVPAELKALAVRDS